MMHAHVQIVESYSGYEPPTDIPSLIAIALRIVPKSRTVGLRQIVLTNKGAQNRVRRRRTLRSRKRKLPIESTVGLYRSLAGNKGEIHLFVDSIIKSLYIDFDGFPGFFLRECALDEIGRVLYHELGHHIDHTIRPEYGESETIAERYEKKFLRMFRRRRIVYRVFAAAGILLWILKDRLVDLASALWPIMILLAKILRHPIRFLNLVWFLVSYRRSRNRPRDKVDS